MTNGEKDKSNVPIYDAKSFGNNNAINIHFNTVFWCDGKLWEIER